MMQSLNHLPLAAPLAVLFTSPLAAVSTLAAAASIPIIIHLLNRRRYRIVEWAAMFDVPAFPGCATPTEILAAWRAGAAAVKVFPASVLGPGFIRELRGPFPDIPLLPTGGVTLDTAPAFIAAGAIGVGMGGWLLGDGDATGIRERAGQVVGAVAAARSAGRS